jgi:hypothetical protein
MTDTSTPSGDEITPEEVLAIHNEATESTEPSTEVPDPVGVTLNATYVCPLCGWCCLVEGPEMFDEVNRYHYRGQHPNEVPPTTATVRAATTAVRSSSA